MELHKCPHPKCDVQIPTTLYACRTHWFALPESIRKAIWAGYKGGGDWEAADRNARTFWTGVDPVKVKEQILDLFTDTESINTWTGEVVDLRSKIKNLLELL